jgi:hypothetical protein
MMETRTGADISPGLRARAANFDMDIEAAARRRLTTARHRHLKRVSCRGDADSLVLRGEVPSFYLKQLAQEVVRGVASGRRIVNLLEVRP